MPLVLVPFGTIDDSGRVELSSEVVEKFVHTENLLMCLITAVGQKFQNVVLTV